MGELIDKRAAINAIDSTFLAATGNGSFDQGTSIAYANARLAIVDLPAAKVGVKPLEWKKSPDGNSRKGEVFSARSPVRLHPIAIHKMHGGWWLTTDQKTYPSLESAQAAAFEIERDMILAAITPQPAPTLGDALELPEIKALIEAARPFYAAVFNDNGDVTVETSHIVTRDWARMHAALAALKGPKP
jgi:hypothetical protein